MPVPSTIADLSTTLASNSPAGSDAILPNLDDYLRAHARFIAQIATGDYFNDTVHLEGATQGTLGVMQGAGSGGTANTIADEVVVDGAGNAGISILTGNTSSGNLLFGDTDSNAQGRVRYDHSIDELSLWASNTQFVTLTSAGRFILSDGTTISYSAGGGITPDMQMHGITQGDASLGLYSWSNVAATDPTLAFSKSESGTVGTRGVVSNGAELGTIAFSGDDGTVFVRGARIRAVVSAAPGANDMPTSLQFSTTPNGSDAPALALTLDEAQQAIFTGNVFVEGSGASIGYRSGAGGAVTQTGSKADTVILNKGSGQITMHNASLAASSSVSFTLTNSVIDSNDCLLVNIASAATANSYNAGVTAVNVGNARIQVHNITAGALGEALVLNFAVIRGASS